MTDPTTPTTPHETFPIVGLGSSAGGLEALQTFFDTLPAEPGIAFVVITHLHAGQPTLLPQILARRTKLDVVVVDGANRVKKNHVYLAPPGSVIDIIDGTLSTFTNDGSAGPRMPIDHFFRSLASDQGSRAIGVILSGTGSDGSLGLREIKAAGGLVLAQTEASARYTGMPHSAIATDMVDIVLPVTELAGALIDFTQRKQQPALLSDETSVSEDLQRVFLLLRNRTGHDFSSYKRNTIRRRIERRIVLHHLDDLKAYIRLLHASPEEREMLFRELLIGVTSFFRDPWAFDALAAELPRLFSADRDETDLIRAWVPACATGEEAYSIAILLREAARTADRAIPCQVFATDIDPSAIEIARTGVYPDSIAADVSPERVERNFVRDGDTYRARKELRDMLIFAPQNVISDPPFTKLDLLSCRNLLIYLNGERQSRLIPMFHYALRPGGILFLGSSESIGDVQLFDTQDKKAKIFLRRDTPNRYISDFPSRLSLDERPYDDGDGRRIDPHERPQTSTQAAARVLLHHLVPPSVIVRERGDIVHIHGRTGHVLEPAPGAQVSNNIFNMAREGLQLDLASALRQAVAGDAEVVRRNVHVRTNGDKVAVDLRVRKLTNPDGFRGMYLVAFDRIRPVVEEGDGALPSLAPSASRTILELERELQGAKEVHQGTVEELETTNEELKASNEELQSTNEELQSANEELETSKEEMQSLNEELQTVNAELQVKLEELSRTNDDMQNLFNGTDIATLFLDRDLNIKRFTEQARRVIRLIATDVGRPITDIRSTLIHQRIADQAREVLDTLVFQATELRNEDGKWYLMRILPYRTNENVIDGLVITFVDISMVKTLQHETERFLAALKHSPTTVFGQDRSLKFEWACGQVFGYAPEEVLGKTEIELLPRADAERIVELKRRVLDTATPVRDQLGVHVHGDEIDYDLYLEPRRDASGTVVGITGVATELPPRREGK